jgi:FlgD Ig-like domain
MTITVANASGQVVRTLASGFSVGPGDEQIVWDGHTAAGHNVPDGVYTATVTSTDPQGNVSTQKATIVIQRPPAPLLRTLYKTYVTNALVGSPRNACQQLTPSEQAKLERRNHKRTCQAALLKIRAAAQEKDPALAQRGLVVRSVNQIAQHLKIRQTSTLAATATYQSRVEFKATETNNRWLITS